MRSSERLFSPSAANRPGLSRTQSLTEQLWQIAAWQVHGEDNHKRGEPPEQIEQEIVILSGKGLS
jgi:hypothetical protein